MNVYEIYVVAAALGLLMAVLGKRDHLLNMRPRVARIVTIMGVLSALGAALTFIDAALGGALLGFSTAMAHGAAGTVLGSWLRLSLNKEEYLRRRDYQQRYGDVLDRHGLTEVAPDEALYTNYGKGTFVLWCCLSSLLGPLTIFLGNMRVGFPYGSLLSELIVLLVALICSGALIFFGYRVWNVRLEEKAARGPPSGI